VVADHGLAARYAVGADGRVFALTRPDPSGPSDVVAVDAVTGRRLWQAALPDTQPWSGWLAVGDGHVIVADREVWSLDAATGAIQWTGETTRCDTSALVNQTGSGGKLFAFRLPRGHAVLGKNGFANTSAAAAERLSRVPSRAIRGATDRKRPERAG
jgi:outer membrane protein assembly factor BamB